MVWRPQKTDIALFAVLLVLTTASDAFAYIDPGVGSYLFQLLIAGGLAGIYTVRKYWDSLKSVLRRDGRPRRSGRDGMA